MRLQNTQFWVGPGSPPNGSCSCPIPSALEGLAAVSARGTAVACGCPLLPMFAFRERIRRQRQYIDMEGERLAAGEGRIADPEDFEAAFREHFPPVYRFISRRVGSALAEDLAAETFATAYRRRGCLQAGPGALRSSIGRA